MKHGGLLLLPTELKKKLKVNVLMSRFVQSRNSTQCHTHHQKMIENYTSVPGIIAGCLLVFIPAVGEFVIPALLGDPGMLMIGKVLWTEFFNNRDWPVASAVAIVLLLFLVIPMMYFQRAQDAEAGGVHR